jgi:hypothetical protein
LPTRSTFGGALALVLALLDDVEDPDGAGFDADMTAAAAAATMRAPAAAAAAAATSAATASFD